MKRADIGPIAPALVGTGVAVLVDGENVNAAPATELLRGVGGAKGAAVRRVYGDAQILGAWGTTPGFRIVHTHSGKNSADMRLCIDAVHLSHGGETGCFVIVTSDGDFSHLAHHLRERHFQVIGIGESKTPDVFRAACSQFIEIRARQVQPPCKLGEMDGQIRALILKHGTRHGLPIKDVNAPMRAHGTKISTHGDKTWRGYFCNRPELYACDPKGPNARVRWVGPGA